MNISTRRLFVALTLAITSCLTPVTCLSQGDEPGALQAGAAVIDVSPRHFPVNMLGQFHENFAETAHDPLHARAIVFKNDQSSIAMVVVDNLGVDPDAIEAAKQLAAKQTNLPIHQIMVSSTHTHTAPPTGITTAGTTAAKYRELMINGIAESIVQAHNNLRTVEFGFNVKPLAEEVFNRRWHLKPGKMPLNPFGELDQVKMNPGNNSSTLDRPAGPTDPDITIISLRDAKHKPYALFANYSLHYVGAVPRGGVSADYFGEFARLMPIRLRASTEFVAMMSNGTSGDINNIPFGSTRPPRELFEQIQIVARKTSDVAWHAYQTIPKYETHVALHMLQREITLRYRKPTSDQLKRAKSILKITDQAELDRLPRLAVPYANRTVLAAARPETVNIKIQVIRIGELGICCIPFETFAEIGLDLKQRSPLPQTMVISIANGRYGYLPTPAQHRLGGYETWLGTNIVQKDTSVILTTNLLEMLEVLSSDNSGTR
jgi:neutral ceramidase